MKDLKSDKTRIIMKADKGNSFVVMNQSEYETKIDLKNKEKIPEKTLRQLHSSDAMPPAIRGSIKHHKENHPLRPIVTCINSALYDTSKFLSQILSPLQNRSGFSVANSAQFKNEMTDITIDEDETMISFDVVSLFTAIPVDKACAYIRTKLEHDTSLIERTQLDVDDIIRLLTFVL